MGVALDIQKITLKDEAFPDVLGIFHRRQSNYTSSVIWSRSRNGRAWPWWAAGMFRRMDGV